MSLRGYQFFLVVCALLLRLLCLLAGYSDESWQTIFSVVVLAAGLLLPDLRKLAYRILKAEVRSYPKSG